jgi:integrase
VEFLYKAEGRSKEPTKLLWSQINVDRTMATLPARSVKERKAHVIPLVGALKAIIERRWSKRVLGCPFVFHRSGQQIKSFRRGFQSAAIAAGLGCMIEVTNPITGKKRMKYKGMTPHDTRRSAVRNNRLAGLSENEGMGLSNHQTRSTYNRYDIQDNQDLIDNMTRVQNWIESQKNNRSLVQIKKAS